MEGGMEGDLLAEEAEVPGHTRVSLPLPARAHPEELARVDCQPPDGTPVRDTQRQFVTPPRQFVVPPRQLLAPPRQFVGGGVQEA